MWVGVGLVVYGMGWCEGGSCVSCYLGCCGLVCCTVVMCFVVMWGDVVAVGVVVLVVAWIV